MKLWLCIVLTSSYLAAYTQVVLTADGSDNAYDLITSVLAPGHNPIEVPDCNHEEFGPHIDQIYDSELDAFVFRFHIHTTPDDDRCINFDRQRNEIKTYDKSPDNLLGVENEKVTYRWKFKLETGFQSSPNFTHLHQLKSKGGALASMPMYTLTTRKGTPDQLELRYAETDDQVTLKKTDLDPFIGHWLEVTETIVYGTEGSYEIEIVRLSDNIKLFEYENPSIINWRPEADFVRPKWGIYRSLINQQDLRDETVLFAEFSINELINSDEEILEKNINIVYSNPSNSVLYIHGIDDNFDSIEIFSLDGSKVLSTRLQSQSSLNLDVSVLAAGTYILHLSGTEHFYTQLIVLN